MKTLKTIEIYKTGEVQESCYVEISKNRWSLIDYTIRRNPWAMAGSCWTALAIDDDEYDYNSTGAYTVYSNWDEALKDNVCTHPNQNPDILWFIDQDELSPDNYWEPVKETYSKIFQK